MSTEVKVDPALKYYLTGPMRGYPQCNFPMFIKAAASLRQFGYNIVSPAELDSEATRADAMACTGGEDLATYGGETTGQILARDVRIVADDVDGLILLDGWEKSRGARLEVFVGLLYGKQFAYWMVDAHPIAASAFWIRDALRENLP